MQTSSTSDARLRCSRCECLLEVTADELIRFSRGEWPRCCMVLMILDVDNNSVNPGAGTELERPSRPTRKVMTR